MWSVCKFWLICYSFANLRAEYSDEAQSELEAHVKERKLLPVNLQQSGLSHYTLGDVPAGNLTCGELAESKKLADTGGSWSPLRDKIVRGLADVYGPSVDQVDFRTADSDTDFKGPKHDHLYGEITFDGMIQVLTTAAGLATGTDRPTTEMLSGFEFYDLGSGFGKYPAFAALLGMSAVGVELDTHRSEVGAKAAVEMEKRFAGCVPPGKLRLQSGSFTTDFKEWAEGTQKRIVSIDVAVSSGGFDKLFENVRWAKGSVVASMGFEGQILKAAGFTKRKTIYVPTSWSDHQHVDLYTRGDALSE